MLKKIILILILAFITTSAYSQVNISGRRYGGRRDFAPEPRLLSPVEELVSLKRQTELTFKWSPHETLLSGSARKYYDFRLYRGYELVKSALIFKEKVPGNKHSISLNSELFKDKETYTWSVRQVYRDGGKSRRSVSSFKVIK
ncbi:MAG: hypothetical protein WBB86_00250 [Candidatus Omnitrophota bacterium]